MRKGESYPNRPMIPAIGVWLLIAFSLPASAGFDVQESIVADRLTVRNLIGEITIEGGSGSEFEVEVQVRGSDASHENIEVRLDEGTDAELIVEFPLDRTKRFVYPRLGGGSSSFNFDGDSGWLSKLLGGKRLKVSGSGSGLEVWADVTVRVPRGKRLEIRHGVGNVTARAVDSDLHLSSRSGSVEVSEVNGTLFVDVGSGAVSVDNVRGDELLVDTGSGAVELKDCESDKIDVDTGSGKVRIDTASGSRMRIDTGSGSVRAVGIEADSMNVDTGSGSVRLELDRMGTGDFVVDTGSGGIELHLPPDASATIRAATGSGGIDLDLASGAEIRRIDDDSAVASVGGGAAEVELDTGSGSIRVHQ